MNRIIICVLVHTFSQNVVPNEHCPASKLKIQQKLVWHSAQADNKSQQTGIFRMKKI